MVGDAQSSELGLVRYTLLLSSYCRIGGAKEALFAIRRLIESQAMRLSSYEYA